MLPGSLAQAASPSSRGSVETPREPSPSPEPALQESSASCAQESEAISESLRETASQSLPRQEEELPSPAHAGLPGASTNLPSELPLELPAEPLQGHDGRAGGWSLTNLVGNLRLPWSRSRRSKSARVSAVPLAAIAEGVQQSSEQEQASHRALGPQQSLRSKHQPIKAVSAEPQGTPHGQAPESAALSADNALPAGGLSDPEADGMSSRKVGEPVAEDVKPGERSEPAAGADVGAEKLDEPPADNVQAALDEPSKPAREDATSGDSAAAQAAAFIKSLGSNTNTTTEAAPGQRSSDGPSRGAEPTPEIEAPRAHELDLEESLGSVSPSTQAGPSPAAPETPSGRLDTFLSDDGSSPAASNVVSQQGSEGNGLQTGRSSLMESLPNSAMPSSRSFGFRSNPLDAQERIRAEWYKRLKADTDWDQAKVSSPKSTSLRPRHGSTESSSRPSGSSLRSGVSRRGGGSRNTHASSEAPSPRSPTARGPGLPPSPTGSQAGPGPLAPGPALSGMPGPALPGMPGMPGPALPGMPGPALPGMPRQALPGQSARLLPGPAASSPKGQRMPPGPPLAEAPPGHRPNQPGRAGGPGSRRPPSWAFVAP